MSMESSEAKNTLDGRSLQDILSLGYLYLLILGISREVIRYGFLDINILTYSSILDVLLSPIALLATNSILFLVVILFPFVVYYFFNKKDKKENPDLVIPKGQLNSNALRGTLNLLALFLFAFFVGAGIGDGFSDSRKIKKGDFKLTHQITFMDNKKMDVRLVGNNSQFVFYVLENKKQVSISPIQGNVKTIDKLKKEKEEEK